MKFSAIPSFQLWRQTDANTEIQCNPPWETLPKDIIENISRNLNLYDYIRLAAVCKSWGSILLQSDVVPLPKPWLLLPHHGGIASLRFFSVLRSEFHTINLPSPLEGGRAIGSSRGWLIMSKYLRPEFKISLYDPISGAHHDLPSLPVTHLPFRIELSSSNVDGCTVAAIFKNNSKLALCKPGDERWEFLQLSSEIGRNCTVIDVIDILFCRRNLYVLIKGTDSEAKIEDLTVKLPNRGESITLIHDIEDIRHTSYLVESINGRLLLVRRLTHKIYQLPSHEEIMNNLTLKRLTVSEMEIPTTGRKILRELKGIGEEQTMFLSCGGRMCLPAVAARGGEKLGGDVAHFAMIDHMNAGDYRVAQRGYNGMYEFKSGLIGFLLLSGFQWGHDILWFAPHLHLPRGHTNPRQNFNS